MRNKSEVGYDGTLNFPHNKINTKSSPDFVVYGKQFQLDSSNNNKLKNYRFSYANQSKIYQLEDFEVNPVAKNAAPLIINRNKKQIQINVSHYTNPEVLNKEVQEIRKATEVEDFQKIFNSGRTVNNKTTGGAGAGKNYGLTTKKYLNHNCFSEKEIQDIYDDYFALYFEQLKQLAERLGTK